MNDMAKNLILWLIIAAVLVTVMNNFSSPSEPQTLNYSDFIQQVKEGKVERVTVDGYVITGKRQDGDTFKTIRPMIPDNGLIGDLVNNNVVVEGKQPEQQSIWTQLLVASFPILVIIAVFMFFMRQMQGGGGGRGGPMSFGKSKARLLSEDQVKTTFADVAGCDEAKEEVSELVEFLRDPGKFQRLGGRIPRGVLMVGPPGTGKTLLAKAIAGEAKVPFFTISGSDFVEMFVGVGASRVRDMFDQAKKHAPCIIFIDEIDAVGRHRGAGLGGGHDEREQTLNQLLVEMDGFEANDGIIVIAATNRADVLDAALLRPGRFDRQVEVGLPDVRGREQILKVHMRKVPIGDDVDAAIIARGTPGFSGADLANIVNEASLFAARSNKRIVEMREFELAKDKIIMGAERRSMAMSEEEKLMTAYHESGHAILGCLFPSDPIHKVTIIPRGRALGVTISLPEADRLSYKRDWMHNRLMMIFGGRIAEELIFGYDKVSNGASSDITSASRLARMMVTQWGMSDRLGFLSYSDDSDSAYPGMGRKEFSEETARIIDEEVRSLIEGNYAKAKQALQDNRDKMEVMANALMMYETLDADQVGDIMAGREPREPRDWQGGGSSSSGSATAPRDEGGRQEKPIGGPAGEH
ncbi:MAG: ATP-dependent zinc metalloprotease FtsH [Pseudomonas delhiensis]|nr:MAG: ATP-dependent zinc metalloprotease FtsH [Pseudomonas delhiensis]